MTDVPAAGQAPWKVEVTSPALKGFRRLPEKAAAAIVEFVTVVLADNPCRPSKSLTNELLSLRTARRGDYRVLLTLDTEDHILYVHRIEHRSDVYTPRANQSKIEARCAAGAPSPSSG